MKLSISVFTRNHADWLPRILPQFQRVADELVVVVNNSTIDNSEEVAREYTDRVVLVPHETIPERQTARIVAACSGDWILGLLDDETLSAQWENRSYVERLLSDRYATHYWVPRRWLIPPGDRFISTSRWYPDFQMRLFRNIPSLIDYPNTLHSHVLVAGEPRYLADAWLIHWDLVWRDRSAREKKLEEYALASANPLPDYYLYEGQRFDTEAADRNIVAEHCARSPARAAVASEHESHGVALQALGLPSQLNTGEERGVTVAITNHSLRTLHPESRRLKPGLLWVSYHWLTAGSDDHAEAGLGWENPRHDPPARIHPGETAFHIVSVRAPSEPGAYMLQFDLVEEGIAWFSQFSILPKYSVTVET